MPTSSIASRMVNIKYRARTGYAIAVVKHTIWPWGSTKVKSRALINLYQQSKEQTCFCLLFWLFFCLLVCVLFCLLLFVDKDFDGNVHLYPCVFLFRRAPKSHFVFNRFYVLIRHSNFQCYTSGVQMFGGAGGQHIIVDAYPGPGPCNGCQSPNSCFQY